MKYFWINSIVLIFLFDFVIKSSEVGNDRFVPHSSSSFNSNRGNGWGRSWNNGRNSGARRTNFGRSNYNYFGNGPSGPVRPPFPPYRRGPPRPNRFGPRSPDYNSYGGSRHGIAYGNYDYDEYGHGSRPSVSSVRPGQFVHGETGLAGNNGLNIDPDVRQACGSLLVGTTVPLHRLYNSIDKDHLYTVDLGRKLEAELKLYKNEGVEAEMALAPDPQQGCTCLRKLYRMKHRSTKDHFYTIDQGQAQRAQSSGYIYEGLLGLPELDKEKSFEGYCVPFPHACGATEPLIRYWSDALKDHFYTSDQSNRAELMRQGYIDEGVECWAWAPRS